MTTMTRIIRIIFLLTIVAMFSCEDSKNFTNCDDCTSVEPFDVIIKAELDPNNERGVLVTLWEGRIEDNIIYDSKTVINSSKYEKKVSLNRTYTITATYIINNKSYTVVDSSTPRVRYTEDMCENPCYFIYDKTMDLTLKYTK